MWNAGKLVANIKKIAQMDVADLGSTDTQQTEQILKYMSLALFKLADMANVTKESDVLSITSDGYITFEASESPITDMYKPIRVIDTNGYEVPKRASYNGERGWWKESILSQIHVKGLSGNYRLQYIKYPSELTSENDTVEFPANGYYKLMFETIALIKESKNFYDEAAQMIQRSERG